MAEAVLPDGRRLKVRVRLQRPPTPIEQAGLDEHEELWRMYSKLSDEQLWRHVKELQLTYVDECDEHDECYEAPSRDQMLRKIIDAVAPNTFGQGVDECRCTT